MTETSKFYDQKELLDQLKEGNSGILESLYKEVYPMVKKYVCSNKGSDQDALDILQDGIFLFLQKTKETDFQLSSKISTFIYGICRNLWLKQLTAKKIDFADYSNELHYEELYESVDLGRLESVKKMRASLDQLGEPCKTILEKFYFLKETMKEIATYFHYSNPENAKNQKYKCLMRLKKIMLDK